MITRDYGSSSADGEINYIGHVSYYSILFFKRALRTLIRSISYCAIVVDNTQH